jgi:amidase
MSMLRDAARAFMPYPDAPVAHAASGPLSGLTFAVKDLFDVAGYPTSGGQPFVLAMSGIKTTTAPTVQRLLDAGARFVGKTITDELAFSMNGQNAHFGSPVNGAAPDRISGGSSSGSASAVSNQLCDFALGSDTGGSVRAPASHCALVGLRPTHARIPLAGVLDLAPSFDTCGWFTRDVPTFARVADVLLGADPAPLPERIRLLAPTDLWGLVAPEVLEAQRGPRDRVESVLGGAAPVEVVLDGFDSMYWSFRYLQGREAWHSDGALIERFRPPLGPGVEGPVRVGARGQRHAGRRGDGVPGALPFPPRRAARPRRRAGDADDARRRAARQRRRGRPRGLPQPGDAAPLQRRPGRLAAAVAAAGRAPRRAARPLAARAGGKRSQPGAARRKDRRGVNGARVRPRGVSPRRRSDQRP